MRDSKRLVYICSPLRGDSTGRASAESNIRRAHEYCAYAAGCGVIPLAPHTIFTNYLDDANPTERQKGLEMGLALLKRCDEIWVMNGEVSEGMQGEIECAKKEKIPQLYIPDGYMESGYKIRQEDMPFDYLDCIPGSEKMDYNGQILVLNHKIYADSNSATADDSLWIAHHGFGCTFGARGQSVFAESLMSGENVRFDRCDFHGIVDPVKLFSWMCDKPIHNVQAEETIKSVAEDLSDYSRETDEEMEADM